MKDELAIAAVMNTISTYLGQRMKDQLDGLDVQVTVQPPDKIPDDANLVNLFLYDLKINPAFRNDPLPGRTRGLESGPPPLPLDLYFLLSAYATENSALNVERILGLALLILHDTPVLGPVSIPDGADTYTYDHAERIRLTPVQLSLDELTKIWTSFKGPLVPSMSYRVSVVLLESDLPASLPAPVLRRGDADRGPAAVATPVPPFPTVDELVYAGTDPVQASRRPRRQPVIAGGDPALGSPPRRQPVFEVGDPFVIRGTSLAMPGVAPVVMLWPPGGGEAVTLPTDRVTATEIAARLDAALVAQAGYYRLVVELPTRPGREPLRSPEVPLLVAPVITDLSDTLQFAAPAGPGQPRPAEPLAVECDVTLLPGQDVRLLIAGRDVPRADPSAPPPPDAEFDVPEIPSGTYPVRLRVDGVDSLPIVVAGRLAVGREVTVSHA